MIFYTLEYVVRTSNNNMLVGTLSIINFLEDLMRRRKKLPSQLAADIGVSHVTMHRWLAGKDIPSSGSCRLLASYSGIPIQQVMAEAGHISEIDESDPVAWPEFRQYARQKYPQELDEDIITMIEDLIERKRQNKVSKRKKSSKGDTA